MKRIQLVFVLGLTALASLRTDAAVRVVGLGGGGAEMRALNSDLDSYLEWASEQPELWGLDPNRREQMEGFLAAEGLMSSFSGVQRRGIVFIDSYDNVEFRPNSLTVLRASLQTGEVDALSTYMKSLFQARIAHLNGQVRPLETEEFQSLEGALFDGLQRYDRYSLHLENGTKLSWSALKIRDVANWKLELRANRDSEINLLPKLYAALDVDFGEVDLVDLDPPRVEGSFVVLKVKWQSGGQLHTASLVTEVEELGARSVFRVVQKSTLNSCESWVVAPGSDLF